MKNYKQPLFSLGVAIAFLMGLSAFTGPKAEKNPENQQAEATINWLTIEEAQKLSENEPRKVFVDVYTDWCGWCKKMDKTTFTDASVVEYANKHFYAVKLKADSDNKVMFHGKEVTQAELARALRVSGYPTIVFFDESFKQFQPVSGFRQPDEFMKMLKQVNGETEAGG
jgi:thioredoxin-related protein